MRGFCRRVALVLTAGCVLACAAGCMVYIPPPEEVDAARVESISAAAWQNPSVVIIDLRSKEEYARGHIPGARNIQYGVSGTGEELARLDRKAAYILYCRAGAHSLEIRDEMRRMGFSEVTVMRGGFLEWTRAGYRTER